MSRYLIDTNILSEPIKPHPNPKVIAIMQQNTDVLAIAATTWHEIQFGYERLPPSRRRETLEPYLQAAQSTFPVLPYDAEAARWHATERARTQTAISAIKNPRPKPGVINQGASTNSLYRRFHVNQDIF